MCAGSERVCPDIVAGLNQRSGAMFDRKASAR
jgi:hypothetical protein